MLIFVKNVILQTHIHGLKLNNIKFITEIASTHDGSIKDFNKLIKNIKIIKGDYIKFQIFKNSELCHSSSKLFKGLKKIELPFKFWEKIINKNKKKKKIILEPFDEKSYIFSKKFKKDVLIKISSSEHDNQWMIHDAIKNFKKVFLNISGYHLKDILKLFKDYKSSKNKIILMYGFQSFPSNPEDLRLNILKQIIKIGYKAGYADHSETEDLIGTYISTARAIDLGATYIEKHVTLDRSKKKPDYVSSFNPIDHTQYANFFKNDYKKFIINRTKISKKEIQYCQVMGKYAVSNRDLNLNENLNYKDIKFLRTGSKGLNRNEINNFLKKKSFIKKKIKKNSLIKLDHLGY